MASKNLSWAIFALCGSLLTVTAPTVTQAADQPAAQTAKADAKQGALMCRDMDIPGSHIKYHICGTPEQWSDVRGRLSLLRRNEVASYLSLAAPISAPPNTTMQRY
jgi:hypothetical protein